VSAIENRRLSGNEIGMVGREIFPVANRVVGMMAYVLLPGLPELIMLFVIALILLGPRVSSTLTMVRGRTTGTRPDPARQAETYTPRSSLR
jgi:hypothetical protein